MPLYENRIFISTWLDLAMSSWAGNTEASSEFDPLEIVTFRVVPVSPWSVLTVPQPSYPCGPNFLRALQWVCSSGCSQLGD